MKKPPFFLVAAAAGLTSVGAPLRTATLRPNILFIFADDRGLGAVGFPGVKTRPPVLDRLADEGVELTQHAVNPPCSPRAPRRSSLA